MARLSLSRKRQLLNLLTGLTLSRLQLQLLLLLRHLLLLKRKRLRKIQQRRRLKSKLLRPRLTLRIRLLQRKQDWLPKNFKLTRKKAIRRTRKLLPRM